MDKKISAFKGLSDKQAAEKLAKDGYNELPSQGSRGFFRILLEIFKEPMIFLLLACGSLYFFLGDRGEAVLMMGCIIFIIAIELVQENKTEKTLKALKDLSSPRALVVRNGRQIKIAGREVVVGDIVILGEGDRIPADILLLTENNFGVNESLLTGESLAVDKKIWSGQGEPDKDSPHRRDYYAYAGTLAVKGQAVGRVVKIGAATAMGEIGVSLKTLVPEKTFLQIETESIVKKFALAGLLVCLAVLTYFTLVEKEILQGILAGLTLAIAILPEEFPVVLTVFLALGAWRISKKHVLARRVTAVEMLGAATVLCSDKTGTLTQNKMTIDQLCVNGQKYAVKAADNKLPELYHEVMEYAVLASSPSPFEPMEKAIRLLSKKTLVKTEHWHEDWQFVKEHPLSDSLLAMSRVWRDGGKKMLIAAKGAPEAIIDLCHLSAQDAKAVLKDVQALAADGCRVIAVAKANFILKDLPANQHDYDFKFVGLLGLADPIRSEAKEAIAQCRSAGIRVIMITGDYELTAKHIAGELNLVSPGGVLNGTEIDLMTVAELKKQASEVNIFARVMPEQKLKLVQALKADGQVVAMTGDGVNDAPALKAAHIGVAMGGRGTDVAREASGLVLLDDNFASIVAAIRMGRRVYDNLKKAMSYVLVVHLPIIAMSVIPVFFGLPIALLPAHIVFLEIIIDPSCSVAFEMEPEEAGIMDKPPRPRQEKIFDRQTLLKSIIRGLLASALCTFIYIWGVQNWPLTEARLVGFASLVAVNLAYILIGRSETRNLFKTVFVPNAAVWLILVGAVILQVIVLSSPAIAQLFGFSTLKMWHLGWILSAFLITIIIGESTKVLIKKRVSG